MRCALFLLVVGVLAAASAQLHYAPEFAHDLPQSYSGHRGHHDYFDHPVYQGYGHYRPNRRRPHLPPPYDEHRAPGNHPAYHPAHDNYLPNYYNYPSRNPTEYLYGSYWYPTGPGPYPNTNPQGWFGHRRPYYP